jgi:ketosteroid isomerase-like protein
MGDHVSVTVRLTQKIRATGKVLEQPEVVHRWTFRNGKVVRCRVLEDTAATRAAFAGNALR